MSAWGPLAEPIHADAAQDGDPPWRDNAYLAFWSPAQTVFGVVHVTTSPNGDGRRARASLDVDGRSFEVAEPLEPGTFASPSIDYRLDGRVVIDTPELSADLRLAPRFVPGDYTAGEVLPGLDAFRPLHHYQQGADVSGTLTAGERRIELRGAGIRDRTWGFRDESSSWIEHLALFGCFAGFDFTVMKFSRPDGSAVVDGFVMREAGAEAVSGIRTWRDPSSLFSRCVIETRGGELAIESTERLGGFWAPLGEERAGPVYSAYDEMHEFDAGGVAGHGIAEQGYLRRIDA